MFKFCKYKRCIYRSCRSHWVNRKSDNVVLSDLRGTELCRLRKELPALKRTENDEAKYQRRPVICLETEILYDSAKAAAQEVGVSPMYIRKCCRGELASAAGFTWMYAE